MKGNDGGAIALDRIVLKILEHLQSNGRMTNQELADCVGLSASPCLSRVRRLERAGVIAGYQAQIALSRICRHVDVVAAVTLKPHGPNISRLSRIWCRTCAS